MSHWCECEFKEDTLFFKSSKLACTILTKDEDDNIYRPAGNLSEFYENLKNKSKCKINFDCKNKSMTISYPEYDFNWQSNYDDHRQNVKFEMDGVIIIVSYDSCFEAICEFLKQFQFTM